MSARMSALRTSTLCSSMVKSRVSSIWPSYVSAPSAGTSRLTLVKPSVVVLAVEDQGYGIPAKDLPHLFEPFYRSQQPYPRHAGVGFGLAVVQRIASALGGTFDIYI